MNTSQITNIVTTLIGLVCGIFIARGWMTNSDMMAISAFAVWLVSFIASHAIHKAANPNSPSQTGSNGGAALLLALAFSFCLLSGCASGPQNAYKGEGAADITVSAAMTAWGDYVAQNHPSIVEEAAVKNAFEKYQLAELLAIDATATYTAATSTNSGASSADMSAASAAAAQALTDLINLLQQFGVKL